jgi:hypothetical protein
VKTKPMKSTELGELQSKMRELVVLVEDDLAANRSARTDKREQIERVKAAPLPISETVERIGAEIRQHAREASDRGEMLLRLTHHAARDLEWSPAPGEHRGRLETADLVDFGCLMLANGGGLEPFLEGLERVLASWRGYGEPGATAEERAATIARLEQEISRLEADEETVLVEAAAAGIRIEPSAELAQKRAIATEEEERAAEAKRHRDRIEASRERDRAAGREPDRVDLTKFRDPRLLGNRYLAGRPLVASNRDAAEKR